MAKKKTYSINEELANMEKLVNVLKENYVFDEDTEDPYDENMNDSEDVIDGEENLAKSDERISQVREISLGGLQEYANNVDSEQYQFWKKIWLMCDKAVSEKDSVSSMKGV